MVPELPPVVLRTLLERAGSLRGLGLDNCALGDVGAQVLTRVPAAQCLERVIIPCNGLTRHGVETLVNAPLPRVELLDLQGATIDEAMLHTLRHRTGVPRLRTLVLNNESAVPTGQTEFWYDQGAVVGESPEMLRLFDVQKRYFANDAVTLTDSPSRWPASWLAPGRKQQ